MTLGAPQDQNAINARIYGLSVNVRDVFNAIANFKAFIDSKTDADLTTGISPGFTPAEVTLLRAAATDLDNLRKVGTGLQTQPSVSNFLFNSNKLVGPN